MRAIKDASIQLPQEEPKLPQANSITKRYGGAMIPMFRSRLLWATMLTGLLVVSCGDKEEPQEVIRPVRYQQVFSTGGTRIRDFSGVAKAGTESRLSFRVPGRVRRVAVQVGERVETGQLLAELDPEDYQLKVQQAEASLTQAQAQARNAEANYTRVRALYENNSASASDLDASRAASESAKAAVEAARKLLELARMQRSYTRLEAPATGAIAQVEVEVNENVQAGQTVLVLTSGSQIEVSVSIPELLISQIQAAEKVQVSFDALPEQQFPARVTEVGVASTGLGTTFPVTVRLDLPSPEIRPGMAAAVSFQFASQDQRERILVPSQAVGEDRDGRFVYVVEPSPDNSIYGYVHRRAVTVGELTEDGLEIFEGVTDGDLVVTAGVSRITDGQKVKIL